MEDDEQPERRSMAPPRLSTSEADTERASITHRNHVLLIWLSIGIVALLIIAAITIVVFVFVTSANDAQALQDTLDSWGR